MLMLLRPGLWGELLVNC